MKNIKTFEGFFSEFDEDDENFLKVGSLVSIPEDEFQGPVVAINGDVITVETPFGNKDYDIEDLELLGSQKHKGQ
jgi:hypothetical protein